MSLGGICDEKILLMLGLVIIIGICLWMFFMNPEKLKPDNPAGKTVYYTMITGSGVQDDNERYDYVLAAFNEKGEEKNLSFPLGNLYHTGFRELHIGKR
ncbi:DUF1093 domain-containing protein [Niallia circulans]